MSKKNTDEFKQEAMKMIDESRDTLIITDKGITSSTKNLPAIITLAMTQSDTLREAIMESMYILTKYGTQWCMEEYKRRHEMECKTRGMDVN